MVMKNLMLIINPVAGRSSYTNKFAEAMHLLDRSGYRVTTYFTRKAGSARKIAREHGAEYEYVICIGGDGTLSEVVSGLMEIRNKPKLGYFPMGTANDVATTINLPKNDCLAAAESFIKGTPHLYDIGGMGDKYFVYIAAFGAFTEVSYATPQDQKKALGHLAYVLQGAAALPYIEKCHVKVEYDDGVIEDDFIYGSMSNSTSVAGIVKLREEMVSLGDGMSEVVLVKDPGDAIGFAELVNSVLSKRFDSPYMTILHTTKAKFTFDKPTSWTRDGESGGTYTDVELVNYPHPVELIF